MVISRPGNVFAEAEVVICPVECSYTHPTFSRHLSGVGVLE